MTETIGTNTKKPRHGLAATWKWCRVVVPLVGTVIATVISVLSYVKSNSNKSDIQTLHRVYDNLAKVTEQQNVTWQKQYEAQQSENAKLRQSLDAQQDEIARFKREQANFARIVATAQATGSLRQAILVQRKNIKELWELIDDKQFYLGPDIPSADLLRLIELSGEKWDKMVNRNAEPLKYLFAPVKKYNPADDEREAALREKEVKINELLTAAKALHLIEEMPESMKQPFKKNLDLLPTRPIYRFVGESGWWTVFQDLPELAYIPTSQPTTSQKSP